MMGMHDATVIQAVDPQFPERAAGLQRRNLCPDVFGSRPGRDLLRERLADREIVPQVIMDRFQLVQQVLSQFPALCHPRVPCSAPPPAAPRSRTPGATSPMHV